MGDDFDSFFGRATGFAEPYAWQREVARRGLPDLELIKVPTGFGKTEGAVLPWLYRTQVLGLGTEGRRLLYTLPMRSLVRQTLRRVGTWLSNLGMTKDVDVVALAGGGDDDTSPKAWMERPERYQIVIGTQDRLLSGALGRGYALSRFQWPVALGLLNVDCHWVIDETQLMGPGLWTTAQLDWMRRCRFDVFGSARTTWMSATLSQGFLETVDRRGDLPVSGLRTIELGEVPKHAEKRRVARRPLVPFAVEPEASERAVPKKAKGAAKAAKAPKPAKAKKGDTLVTASPEEVANAAWAAHRGGTLTLVIANTVARAQAIYEALDTRASSVAESASKAGTRPELLLLTSRLRGGDRAQREEALNSFEAARKNGTLGPEHPGLLCVATQVVEAGVDISAERLFSDLAPWASIVQRLGRMNRDGSASAPGATFYWSEAPERGAERLGPYPVKALELAQKLLDLYGPLADKAPALDALAELEARKDVREALEEPVRALVRARDVYGLFGNEADLRGGFVDVSAFIRDTDPEVDVAVYWRAWKDDERAPPPAESDGPPVVPSECCAVGVFALRKYLKDHKRRAWRWDDRRASWVALDPASVLPGMQVMLGSKVGGYDPRLGWTGLANPPGKTLAGLSAPPSPEADDDDPWVEARRGWVGLSQHLGETEVEARNIVATLPLPESARRAVIDAARLHDLGKALPAWQKAIVRGLPGVEGPVAKSPTLWVCRCRVEWTEDEVRRRLSLPASTRVVRYLFGQKRGQDRASNGRWLVEAEKKPHGEHVRVTKAPFRPGLRHEAASALAMWHRYRTSASVPFAALAVYLAASHHGKVRTSLMARGRGGLDVAGLAPSKDLGLTLGDETWELDYQVADVGLAGTFGEDGFVPVTVGWSGLVVELLGDVAGKAAPTGALRPGDDPELSALGPFRLAFLEALVRAADVAASRLPGPTGQGGG